MHDKMSCMLAPSACLYRISTICVLSQIANVYSTMQACMTLRLVVASWIPAIETHVVLSEFPAEQASVALLSSLYLLHHDNLCTMDASLFLG